MTSDTGSLMGDLTGHRNSAAQRAKSRSAGTATSLEMELSMLVDQVIDEDVESDLIEELIDGVTSMSGPPDVDYDGDTMDAFSVVRQDAIDALIGVVDKEAPLAVDGLVMALAWELLDMTTEGEFLRMFDNLRAQVEGANRGAVNARLAWAQS